MIGPIALSTSWNGGRHRSTESLLEEVAALGFRRLEVHSLFTEAQLEDLLRGAPDHGIEVAGLHAPCPLSEDWRVRTVEEGDHLASLEEDKRLLALQAVERTLDFAARHGVRAVVVHLGHLEVPSRQSDVARTAGWHGRGSEVHRQLLESVRREREAAAGPHLAAALRSLRVLGEHAASVGVPLGVECRDAYHEIPDLEEMALALESCRDLPVGYWHDSGHAAKLEYAGFVEPGEYLRRHGDRLLGMHLHDFDRRTDHLAPGQGVIDFGMLRRQLRPETLVTLELSSRVPAPEVVRAREFLESW